MTAPPAALPQPRRFSSQFCSVTRSLGSVQDMNDEQLVARVQYFAVESDKLKEEQGKRARG